MKLRLFILFLFLLVVCGAGFAQNDKTISNEAVQAFERGEVFYKKGALKEAIAEYTKAIEIEPKWAEAYIMRGYVRGWDNNKDLRIKDYETAAVLNPQYLEYVKGAKYNNENKYKEAIEIFNKLIQNGIKLFLTYDGRAHAYYGIGNYEMAVLDFTEAIRLNPQFYGNYSNRAYGYLGIKDYSKAIEDFTKALELNPNSSDAWSGRGYVLLSSGDYSRAIEDYSKAILLKPEEAVFWINRGFAYYAKGELDPAIVDFSKAILLDPNNDFAYGARGAVYNEKNEPDLAIADYTRAISLNPDADGIWYILFSRGKLYRLKQDYIPAIEDFTRALELNPGDGEIWKNRALCYTSIQKNDLAVVDFRKAVELDPADEVAWYGLGLMYKASGEHDLAIEVFNKALALNPNGALTLNDRGETYSAKGEFDNAIEDFNKALALNPNNASAWYNRGKAYNDKNVYDHAINDFTKAIELNPVYPLAYLYRGLAYYFLKDNALAIDDFNKALETISDKTLADNTVAIAYYGRGAAYFNMNEYDLAIEDFNKAIMLDKIYADAYNVRGFAYYRKGELDRAIEDLNASIALIPNNPTAWSRRGDAYLTKGEIDRAIDDYTKAIDLNPGDASLLARRGNAYSTKAEMSNVLEIFDKAIADFNKAIDIESDDADLWVGRGIVHSAKGNSDSAIKDYNKAISLDPNNYRARHQRATFYEEKGDLDRAIEDYTKAITLYPEQFASRFRRGESYYKKKEFDLALDDFRQTINIANKSSNILDMFFISWLLVGSYYKTYPYLDFGDAVFDDLDDFSKNYINLLLNSLRNSISKAENVRSGLGYHGAEIMTSMIYQYYAGVDFEAAFGSVETAFNNSEALRSRGFLEQMGTEAALKLPNIDPLDAQKVRDLIISIENLKNVLSKLDPQTDDETYSAAYIELTKAEETLSVMDAEIMKKNPRYTELRNPKIATLSQAMSFCGDEMVILEYVLWDSSIEYKAPSTSYVQGKNTDRPAINSYCLVITKNGITPVRLDPHFDYAGNVNELRRLIIRRADIKELEKPRNALYNALIKPALTHIPKNIKNILIVPDGTLGHLPFDILRENASSEDLGLTYRLSFSPSVSVSILASKTGLNVYEPLIAFGGAVYNRDSVNADRGQRSIYSASERSKRDIEFSDEDEDWEEINKGKRPLFWTNLPGTEAEVNNLRSLVSSPNKILMLTGRDVSETKIKQMSDKGELAKYPIVHFACHGYFNEADPARSGIVLSEVSGTLNSEDDGYLTIPEIVLLNINTKMVLLSACETGMAQVRRGDGMVGMARAFMVAGAENVGVSLWSISDEGTAVFMTKLYEKVLREGLAFNEAYYQVKRELRNDAKWGHPFYWAAFTLYK